MSTKITIEALIPDEFERVARWLSDDAINRWLTGEWRLRKCDPKLLAITVRNQKNNLFLVRTDTEPCGIVGLSEIDRADRTAMIWYFLGESRFSGQGIISEAVRQLTRRAFQNLELCSVYAWIMEDNAGSRRVLEKSGFRESGKIRNAALSNGRQVDRIYFDTVALI